jgi:hypothetical protein
VVRVAGFTVIAPVKYKLNTSLSEATRGSWQLKFKTSCHLHNAVDYVEIIT